MKVKTQVKAGQGSVSGVTINVGQLAGNDADNRAGGAGIVAIGGVFNA